MMENRNDTRLTFAVLCAWLLVASVVVFGQDSRPPSDADQIMTLMKKLSAHSASAESLVDPALAGQAREKSLDYFRDPSYQLTIVPTGKLEIKPDGRATLPVRVHFKNLTGELDANVDAKFIQRGGVWYFADFGFLGWPATLVVVLIVGMSIGISFAIVVLILRSRLRKQDKLKGANLIKIFIPIFWPKLFSERYDG